MPRSSTLTWVVAIHIALGAHAGVLWLSSRVQPTGEQPQPTTIAVEIQTAATANTQSPRQAIPAPEAKPTPTLPEKTHKPSPARADAAKPTPKLRSTAWQQTPAASKAEAEPAQAASPPTAPEPASAPVIQGNPEPQSESSTEVANVSTPVHQAGGYWNQVRKALEQAKEYPLLSKRRREADSLVLVLEVNRAGELLDHALVEPSKYARLNAAVETMLARATPLPPMPEEATEKRIRLRYRIDFGLR